MRPKPKECQGCPLYQIGTGFSTTEGKCSNGVLIIGEALGSNEVLDALPFRPHAEAGSVLQTAFRDLGLDRSNFLLWNLVACQPPFNNLEHAAYEEEAILHCRTAHFDRIIARFKPKVILALGNLPLRYLWKKDQKIIDYINSLPETTKEERHTRKKYLEHFRIGDLRGYVLPSVYGIPLIASFHPSGINMEKGRPQLGTLMSDIMKALMIARNGVPKFETAYKESPTIEQAEEFYNYCKVNPNLVISHDIETPFTTIETDESEIEYLNQDVREIDSVQFSVMEGTGIFLSFYHHKEIIEKILARPNTKLGWNNWKFDEINLEYHLGKGSIAGENHDVMWMHKWANQDFVKTGRALQFATSLCSPDFPAWKFLAPIEPENYGCLDVDATLRVFNYYHKMFHNPRFRFKDKKGQIVSTTKSLWEGYIDDIVKLRPILKDMSARGFPIDPIERDKFRIQIEGEQKKILATLQEMYPTHLRRLDPLEGYKTIPKEVLAVEELFNSAEDFDNDGPFYVVGNKTLKELRMAQYLEEHTRKENTTGLVLKEFDIEGFKVKRYCRMEEFKPGSSQQVIKYLEFKGYKIPKKRTKKGERDTTSKDKLQPLYEQTGDELLYLSIYLRELDHMLNTYVGTGKKEGWKLGPNNRVYAEFTFIPVTGQLSSVNPNIQNAPARGTKYSSTGYAALAKQFRRTIAAKSGCVLVSADWSAFHINTLSFEAEDADYMRVGKIDPHSYLAAHILTDYLPTKLNTWKLKKPTNWSQEFWLAKIATAEEGIFRLESISSWLNRSDKDLARELKWWKKNFKMERDSQAKPALLGMGFGMKVGRFFNENRHTFKSKAEPEKILKLIQKLFPKTFKNYHEYIKDLAANQTYLVTRYGYIRRFYDVYDWRLLNKPRNIKLGEKLIRKGNGEYWFRKDGESANECIAYLPANNAFGKKKESMRDFWEYEQDGIIRNLCKEYGLINEIHDDLVWEVEEGKLAEALPIIKQVMESPARYLVNSLAPQGLITKVEIKVGKNWDGFNDDPKKGALNLDGMGEVKI